MNYKRSSVSRINALFKLYPPFLPFVWKCHVSRWVLQLATLLVLMFASSHVTYGKGGCVKYILNLLQNVHENSSKCSSIRKAKLQITMKFIPCMIISKQNFPEFQAMVTSFYHTDFTPGQTVCNSDTSATKSD